MIRPFFAIGCFGLLAACSSSPSPNLDQYTYFSGGHVAGDATSFYWLTERLNMPYTASDYVTAGDYGWYRSEYRWEDGQLREFIREGEQQHLDVGQQPYKIHLRFNQDGEAIYQQYRRDKKVLPLQPEQLDSYESEANAIVKLTKQQAGEGEHLIQGYWDGETFESCTGREYQQLSFNQTLPSFVINRLSSVDSYVAFVGKESYNKLEVGALLLLAEDDYDCLERPTLIEE